MVFSFGDSITEGKPGISYLRYLDRKKFKNFGLGGDTLKGLKNRLFKFLASDFEFHKSDQLLIEIGANDLLLPYLNNLSSQWRKTVKNLIKRGSIPSSNLTDFRKEYVDLMKKLKNRKIDFKVVSIVCIGESIYCNLNQKVLEYNSAIKEICDVFNIEYINFHSWQMHILKQIENNSETLLGTNPMDTLFDTFLTTYMPFSEYISKKRGFSLSVDGVHLNKISAKKLSEMVKTAFIKTE